jgi:CRISPR-associated endonuclease/helicase Cas3
MAWVAGLLHDLGKYRHEFQEYLNKERSPSSETVHAIYGAAAVGHRFDDLASAFAIAGHHAGLHDIADLAESLNGNKYRAQERFAELLELAERELGALPNSEPMHTAKTQPDKRRHEFRTRMLFSMVVDADRLDSERWEKEQQLGRPWQRSVIRLEPDQLLVKLLQARDEEVKNHPKDELNGLRNEVFDACLQKGENMPQGFFSLTVPTGGGKTLSAMAFALAHAKKHKLRRVIVVLPYLSIIEQNADRYRTVFGKDFVLEHHSAVENREALHPNDPTEPGEASDMEKAMENWDAPVIVTTSVQFLETLFAASPGRARKLHNIARSVVIFDEVQTLPTHLLEPTLDVLRELKAHWSVSFLFCSATQPAFKKSANLKCKFDDGEVKEIAPDPRALYVRLRRVDYHIESVNDPWDWQTLAEQILPERQVLCVLNLRRHAFEVWQEVRQFLKENGREADLEGLFHLSSAMCPAHRLDLLGLSKDPLPNNIRARLRNGQPCWVISTQLIEAGVDIDFPVVFRALGPLDSVVQAAGRCNGGGTLRDASGNLRMIRLP